MSSVPFAIRLPQHLVRLIERFGQKTGKSTPDAVRSGIEHAFSSPYRMQILEYTSDRASTVNRVREFLAREPLPEVKALCSATYSALMCLWHWAYMRPDGYATPAYVNALLTITSDLLIEAKNMHINLDFAFYRNTLQLREDEDIDTGIARVKERFFKDPSIRYAELLTRPLEGMSDDLQYFTPDSIENIFNKHLGLLMPVTISGANLSVDENLITQDQGSQIPERERFDIGEIRFIISAMPTGVIIEEGHHSYAFHKDSVIGMQKWICQNYIDSEFEFKWNNFEIIAQGTSIILYCCDGYRLKLSCLEFYDFVEKMKAILDKPKWKWLLARRRELQGDI